MISIPKCRRFFFDCETGGLNEIDHDLVEVAAIVTDPTGERTLAGYAQKVFPEKPVSPGAARVNGYDPEVWAKEAVPQKEALARLCNLARYCIFVSHDYDSGFDWKFYNTALKTHGLKWTGGTFHRISTVGLALPLLQHGLVENLKLPTLAKALGVEHKDVHTAYGDVCACREIYQRLMGLYAGVPIRFKKLLAVTKGKESVA